MFENLKENLFILLLVASAFNDCLSDSEEEVPAHFFYKSNNNKAESTDGTSYSINEATAQDDEAHTNVHLLRDQNAFSENPIEFYLELSNVTDIDEFIERFIKKDSIDPQLGISENAKRSVERALVIKTKPAICQPQDTIVPLEPLIPIKDTKISIFPACTRVKRCGGCCNIPSLSCQPVETVVRNYRAVKYNDEEKRMIEQVIVPIEEHTSCACGCTVKESDCNAYQIYDSSRCLCACTNKDAIEKCKTMTHKKWDDKSCRCVCSNYISCTSGTHFDQNICDCVQEDGSTDSSSSPLIPPIVEDRKRFIVKATLVETDNSTLYDTI